MKKLPLPFLLLALLTLSVRATAVSPSPAVEKLPDGIVVTHGGELTKLEVCANDIIRVVTAHDRAFFSHASLITLKRSESGPRPTWVLISDATTATVRTARLQARINLATAEVSFLDLQGAPILAEQPGARSLEPTEVQREKTFHVAQKWTAHDDESLYGLGQNQLGFLNLKGHDLDLWQHNTTVAVPFLVSSRGYGVLWDNPSFTRFGDLRETEAIPADQLIDSDGHSGGLTSSYFGGANFENLATTQVDAKIDFSIPETVIEPNRTINPKLPETGTCSVRWEGFVEPKTTGLHTFETFANSGVKLWLDGKLVINHWRQGWLPWIDVAQVPLTAGLRHQIKLEWSRDDNAPAMRLRWKTPSTETATALWSQVGDGIDYYFVYGPTIDGVIAGYRHLTGAAPMMPVWSFGLWQSRQRYKTSRESLDVVDGYRRRGIPFDNIVQDWFYWKEDSWGSHEFDPARFPDPDAWIHDIHARHAHFMISVWGKFYPGTKNFTAMHDRGFLYERNLTENTKDWLGHPYTFYDVFNAEARKLFWAQVEQNLFRRGVDAWWMDATEPDLRPQPTLDGQRDYATPTALGTGSRVLNASPLLNTGSVYEGQRSAAPDQRVFILTRSGFAGQQRYAGAVWSGDISSTWTAMRKQITAGLGFTLSGLPYWTMDSGGFSVPKRFSAENPKPADVDEWRELNSRWFQFATFVPLLRAHGESPNREMWEFGGESSPAYSAMLKFDRLRYHLLPYIYSLAGKIARENGTMLRALAFDFTADRQARDITDQYMFGPAFLVNPVTEYQARSREVYLPGNTGWFDFWTGVALKSGQTIKADAPYDAMPVHVRAGSIIPFGPELQYTQEKTADPITLYVYTGADGAFTLYEDDGISYAYERGEFTQIPLHWNEAKHKLTIGARSGSFPAMLKERTFEIVMVTPNKPVGFSFTPKPDRVVHYRGEAMDITIN